MLTTTAALCVIYTATCTTNTSHCSPLSYLPIKAKDNDNPFNHVQGAKDRESEGPGELQEPGAGTGLRSKDQNAAVGRREHWTIDKEDEGGGEDVDQEDEEDECEEDKNDAEEEEDEAEEGQEKQDQGESSPPLSPQQRLIAAAMAIKSSVVPDRFQFSQDIYFHPPPGDCQPDFPPVLIRPTCYDPGGGNPFLVVLVLSSYLPSADLERTAVRTTYGSVTRGRRWPPDKPLTAPVRLVFVLGRPPKQRHRQQVMDESSKYGDLLVADFKDSYQNLTLKVLRGLAWTVSDCPQARFVVKADDDVFINLPLLTTFLQKRGGNNSVYGTPYFNSFARHSGRWAVPKRLYPFSKYPAYLSGTAYALSMDAVVKILKASCRLPLLPIEDAFVTGILVHVAGVQLNKCAGFTNFAEDKASACDFVQDTRLVSNRMNASDKVTLWAGLKVGVEGVCL